jgi:polyisoprenoid-binding protein YceI
MSTIARAVLMLALSCALLLGGAPASAQSKAWKPQAGQSEVAFGAKFRMGDFSGRTGAVSGEFKLDPSDLRHPVTGSLTVEVSTLRTGVDGRDKDLRKVMETDRFPQIRFQVESVEASFPNITDKADVLLTIHGQMFIRDVQRPMKFLGRVRSREGGRDGTGLWVRGDASLKMTEFGITPPRRLFMAVEDQVVVIFDLMLVPAE